ncbi:hypothetical protein [Dictyobacter kobayashii]|uniref:hypothetical protein n=1 Tax=Dictyobacter kobayashii TaxID=2014872 RepID=UPI000F81E77C|nr:hypothetical protein [Dictyobacter kobayashii]
MVTRRGQNSGQQPRINAPAAPGPQANNWSAQPSAQSPWGQAPSSPAWPASNQAPSGMQAPMQTPPVNAMSQQEGAPISASSFIDQNSLPEWLRSAQGQSANPSQPQGSGPRPGGYGATPRVDNMRVPSRPRGDVNPNESSELAANVFASMLGVASATPNYPAQTPQQAGHAGQGSPYGQNNQPGQAFSYGQDNPAQPNPYGLQGQPGQNSPFNQPGQANNYASLGQPGPMGQPGMAQTSMSGMPNPGAMPNTPLGSSGVFPQNYSAGNSLAGGYGNNYPGNVPGQGNQPMGEILQWVVNRHSMQGLLMEEMLIQRLVQRRHQTQLIVPASRKTKNADCSRQFVSGFLVSRREEGYRKCIHNPIQRVDRVQHRCRIQ